MLSADDPVSRVVALALALALIALLLWRAITKDRREYARFRRYRSTARRQTLLRRWLIESIVLFGGSAVLVALVAHPFIAPVLDAARSVGWVAFLVAWFERPAGMLSLALGLALGVVLTVVGLRSARRDGGVVMVGDIAALLPRNRPELGYASGLAVNAGVSEELLFRWALPALLFIVTGEPLSAFGLALLLFAGLHAYQGLPGIIGTFVVGLLLTAVYVLSGSIWLAIVVHIVFDLRTLVLVPVAVYGVHRVPGSRRFPPALAGVPMRGADAAGPEPEAERSPDAAAATDAAAAPEAPSDAAAPDAPAPDQR